MTAPPPAAERLFLVDGYALIYRAFFAMISRPLTTARGENTSAAWGATNFLLRLHEKHRPAYLGWVHDVGVSFREQVYPEYKATREKLDEQLQQDFERAVERIEEILDAFRVPVIGVEGYEADDVIGTLATAAADRGLQAVIVSGDKDFYQLIGPRVVLLNPGRGGPAAVARPPASVIDDAAGLGAVVAECRRAAIVAIDVETSSLDAMRAELIGLSLAVAPGRSWYLPFGHVAPNGELAGDVPPVNLPPLDSAPLSPLRDLLADTAVPKAGHNIKYDWLVLRRVGVELGGVAYDSALASFVLDPGRRSHALDDLSREILGTELRTYADVAGKGRSERPFAAVPVPAAARYCCDDSETVLRLRDAFAGELEDHKLRPLLEGIEIPLLGVLVDMEWTGVLVDRELLASLSRQFATELAALEQAIHRAAGTDFNILSTPQLRTVLFDKLQLPVLKKTKTGASTDYEVLEQLAAMGHEVPRLLIEYRELSKLKSTYVDALPAYINPATGRVHTSFNPVVASTGRLSSSDPNLQNIPVRTERGEAIRRAFVAPPGAVLLTADYSQIELRLLAHLSADPAFVAAFQQGGDIHRQTAAVIFAVPQDQVTAEMRARAKTINFATIYGQGPFALARQLGITQDEARAFIQEYFRRFAGVRAWLDRTVAEARERGYVETLFGRRRYIPELKDKNFNIRAFGERTATNSPLQGSAADLIKIAMIRIHAGLREQRLRSRMVLQVHDELVFEVPEGERESAASLVKRHMEEAAKLSVPLVVSVGTGSNWVDAKG